MIYRYIIFQAIAFWLIINNFELTKYVLHNNKLLIKVDYDFKSKIQILTDKIIRHVPNEVLNILENLTRTMLPIILTKL